MKTPTEQTDRELLADFQREIVALERGGHRVVLSLAPNQAMSLAGQLQLAARHPDNDGSSAVFARKFVEMIGDHFRHSPAVQETIRRGWEA